MTPLRASFWMFSLYALDPMFTLPLTMLMLFAFGVLVYRLIVVRIVNAPMVAQIFTTFGLMILLRSSFSAKRAFVKLQRRHPRIVFPLRRLLRREPEVMPVAWQQVLRLERTVLPRSWRFARRMRLFVRGRSKA